MSLNIFPVRRGSISEIAELFGAHLPWVGCGLLEAWMQAGQPRCFLVAELNGMPVGLGGYGPAGYSRNAWALGPAVTLPAHRGSGIGTALIDARLVAIRKAASASGSDVIVHVASKRPRTWIRHGFRLVEEIDGVAMLCRRMSAGAV